MANCEPHIQVHHMALAMFHSLGVPGGIPLTMPCVIRHPMPRKMCNSDCLEFHEIRLGSSISLDDFNGDVCFVIRDLENLWVLACTIYAKLPFFHFFRKNEIFSSFTISLVSYTVSRLFLSELLLYNL